MRGMIPGNLPEKVYHGTDAISAENIRRQGLDEGAWKAAGGVNGVDEKGFSVTTNRATADGWARARALERGGPPQGVVLEADPQHLPLQQGGPGVWTDPDEFFIQPDNFGQVGPGVFR